MSVSSASLAGKVAFVQGGSRGIGAAIVRRLAAEGASVAFTYVSSADKSRGPVDTDMNPDDGDFAETLKGLMALPRYARSEEIASFVAYLAGPEAAYITGASLTIDGGFSA